MTGTEVVKQETAVTARSPVTLHLLYSVVFISYK